MDHRQVAAASDEALVNARETLALCGGRSLMWLHRRLNDGSGFPEPIKIAGRNYWQRGALRTWIAAQSKQAAA